MTLFADVILPLPIPGTFTYRVPLEFNKDIQCGQRAVVQFGRRKIYTALIRKIHEEPPPYSPKYILSILDKEPIVNKIQFDFWDWLSDYYMSTLGEVMNTALPLGLKLVSESKITLRPDFDTCKIVLNENEYFVKEALINRKKLSINDITKITGLQKTIPLIKNMIDKGIIQVEEDINNPYKPKLETYVCLHENLQNNEQEIRTIFEQLNKKAYKQLQLLMALINFTLNGKEKLQGISQTELLKSVGATYTQLNALKEKNIIQTFTKIRSRLKLPEDKVKAKPIIHSKEQQTALSEIHETFKEKDVILLHGVTSSGKTEIYTNLIQETLNKGKQVLYLLPEIALTTQVISRLQKYFDAMIGVYHSRYNKNEKVEIWNKVLNHTPDNESYKIVIGPRSALFLPFKNLGLIIIDEEHDHSYKQFDPSPRYNARDSAIYLATLHNAKTILGSATPSIESYYNTTHKKYALIELKKRYGGIQMPEIIIADIKTEIKRKSMHSHFSSLLIKHIEEALENKEQVILFQNRRGFSLRLECEICGWIPECINCDVTLTYHKKSNHLRCHYCSYTNSISSDCQKCHSSRILMRGFGTEKIEEELAIIFPSAKIIRMDLDTTRSKHAYHQIINDFENRNIDILVGTQMVTKGLDFDNVSVVGIMNADNMLFYPDFRSPERSYQLMAQVSGRAGRKTKRGKVIIQTYNPQHAIIKNVIKNDYLKTYNDIIQERCNFDYPPFYRLIEIILKHKDYDFLNEAADILAKMIRNIFGDKVLGPEYPLVSRIKNQFIKTILIKIARDKSLDNSKKTLAKQIIAFKNLNTFKAVQITIDVDPI